MARRKLTTEQIETLVKDGHGEELHVFSCPLPLSTLLDLERLKRETGVTKQVLVDRALRQFLDGQQKAAPGQVGAAIVYLQEGE